MQLKTKSVLLVLLCAFMIKSSKIEAFSFAPWQDVSCWWQGISVPSMVLPTMYDYVSATGQTIKEQLSNPWISAATAAIGTACLCGIGFFWYKKKCELNRKKMAFDLQETKEQTKILVKDITINYHRKQTVVQLQQFFLEANLQEKLERTKTKLQNVVSKYELLHHENLIANERIKIQNDQLKITAAYFADSKSLFDKAKN